jgi:four helix bundle protein
MDSRNNFEELIVFKKAFSASMAIYDMSKIFPKEEMFSLTDQIRRSSRSVCANIAEGFRKRIYPKSFIAKLVDADGECSETYVWIKYSNACGFISDIQTKTLIDQYEEIGRLLGYMIKNPDKFIPH